MYMAQLMPLPLTVSCFSKIQIGFTFQVPAHLDSPGHRAVKRCVCVCCKCMECQARGRHAQLCLLGGSSNAAFHFQYCDSLLLPVSTVAEYFQCLVMPCPGTSPAGTWKSWNLETLESSVVSSDVKILAAIARDTSQHTFLLNDFDLSVHLCVRAGMVHGGILSVRLSSSSLC